MLETILCFLIPLSLAVWLFINKLQNFNLDPTQLVKSAEHIANLIEQRTGYDVLDTSNIMSAVSILPKIGQVLMGGISGFAINVAVLVLILYFMLIGGAKMEKYVYSILPFSDENKKNVLSPGSEADILNKKQQATKQKTSVSSTTSVNRNTKGKVIYKIQFLTSNKKLPANSRLFKGYKNVDFYVEKGIYKYTYGETSDFNSIRKMRRTIAKDFKDAFIIAFKDGKKVKY